MAIKYAVQFDLVEGSESKGFFHEALDEADISLRIGTQELFEVIIPTPQGHKRVTVLAKVEKYT